jgi:hypothetical protein
MSSDVLSSFSIFRVLASSAPDHSFAHGVFRADPGAAIR